MDKLFSTDIVQALAYIMPGLALLVPAYWAKSEVINTALQRMGSITALALIIPASLSIGIFLHSASALVQHKIEQSLKRVGAIELDLTERAVKLFDSERAVKGLDSEPRLNELADRLQKVYGMAVDPDNYSEIYIYSRTLMIKDGPRFYDRTQFYSAASVSCRSLILVSLILGGTLLWRLGCSDIRRSIVVIGVLALVILSLLYAKEMNYRLSVHETLRAALLLAADKR